MVFEGFEVHRGFGDSGLYNTKRRVPEKPRREATGPDPTPQNFSQGPVPKSPLSNICPVCVCVCARVVVFVLVSVFVFSFFVFFFSTRAHQAPAPPPQRGEPVGRPSGNGDPSHAHRHKSYQPSSARLGRADTPCKFRIHPICKMLMKRLPVPENERVEIVRAT
jgi:hypothetical protein